MIRAAEQSVNMGRMFDEGGSSSSTPFHKLSEKEKQLLEKRNPIPGSRHPTYLTMIKGAVLALNESKGASKPAILKYMAQHYQLGENLPKINSHLCMALRKALKEGNIEQVKGHGASGSFKMNPTSTMKSALKVAKISSSSKHMVKKTKAVPKKKVVAKVLKPKPKIAKEAPPKPKAKKVTRKIVKKAGPASKLRVIKKRVALKSKVARAKKA